MENLRQAHAEVFQNQFVVWEKYVFRALNLNGFTKVFQVRFHSLGKHTCLHFLGKKIGFWCERCVSVCCPSVSVSIIREDKNRHFFNTLRNRQVRGNRQILPLSSVKNRDRDFFSGTHKL